MSDTVMTGLELPGYAYGEPGVARSAVTMDDLAKPKASALLDEAGEAALAQACRALADVIDVWYRSPRPFVGTWRLENTDRCSVPLGPRANAMLEKR